MHALHAWSRLIRVCDVQEPSQKILDIDTAVQMLHVVLPEGNEHLEPFSCFLKEQTEYKYMNLDQWTSFYRFSEEVYYSITLLIAWFPIPG